MVRAPTKSPSMSGPQRCRHGESAHSCQWCSYQNGKEDGRKAERLRWAARAREMAAAHEADAAASDSATCEYTAAELHEAARDALMRLAGEMEGGDG